MAKTTLIPFDSDDGLFTPGEWRLLSPVEGEKLRKSLQAMSAAAVNTDRPAEPLDDQLERGDTEAPGTNT